MIPLTLVFVLIVVKASQKHFTGQQKYLGTVNGHVEEMYGGHTVVRAFNAEERSLAKFDEENNKLCKAAWKAQFLSGLMMPVMNFVGNVGYVAICIIGASMAAGGTMTIGGIPGVYSVCAFLYAADFPAGEYLQSDPDDGCRFRARV